jgi:hypothetical protein
MVCKVDTRMYTGSDGMSLRPIHGCSCNLHWFAVGVTNGRERERNPNSLMAECSLDPPLESPIPFYRPREHDRLHERERGRASPRPRRPPPPCVGPTSLVDDGGCDRAARPGGSDRAARPGAEDGMRTSLPVLARRLRKSCQLLRHAYPRSHAGGLTCHDPSPPSVVSSCQGASIPVLELRV